LSLARTQEPITRLKFQVERLLEEGEKAGDGEVRLTWKKYLWSMALGAAQGVQYLHHTRYWSDGGTRHNGATGEVDEEEAGWRVSGKQPGGGSTRPN
jgi:hypothetical protein